MKTILHLFSRLLLLGFLFTLTACGDQTNPPQSNSLEGSSWTLVSYGAGGDETVAVAGATTLSFEAGNKTGGKAGCNSFGGSYEVANDNISFREVNSTLMACEDQALMEQESEFLKALQTSESFELQSNRLVISYNADQGQLIFERSGSAPTVIPY